MWLFMWCVMLCSVFVSCVDVSCVRCFLVVSGGVIWCIRCVMYWVIC